MYQHCQVAGVLLLLVSWVNGHGRLLQPPARSSLWRLGYDAPINYDDNQLFCGGRDHQISQGGRCGICGDPYDESVPRTNEIGGPVYRGYISARYKAGEMIEAQVYITANHKGFIEFKLCPVPGYDTEATQECLDRHVLRLADSDGTQLPIRPSDRRVRVRLQLPARLSCQHCVLQWRYHAGNSWGRCADGSHATGCGPQEEFYGCADVAIGDDVGGEVAGPDNRRPTVPERPISPGVDRVPAAKPRPRPRPRTTPSPGRRHCVSVGRHSRVPGMDAWCELNCNHSPAFCPPEMCRCQTGGRGGGYY